MQTTSTTTPTSSIKSTDLADWEECLLESVHKNTIQHSHRVILALLSIPCPMWVGRKLEGGAMCDEEVIILQSVCQPEDNWLQQREQIFDAEEWLLRPACHR